MSDHAIVSTDGTMTAAVLSKRLEEQKEMRKLMDDFVQSQLKDGVDYAPAYQGAKPTLLKPGSEKVALLLNLMPVFEIDQETHNLLSPAVKDDTICYRCKLVDRNTEKTVADGRGACSIKSKRGDVNTAVKIAEKRAQLDATLRVAALSDRFTQDMAQEDKKEQAQIARETRPPKKQPTKTVAMEFITKSTTMKDAATVYGEVMKYQWSEKDANDIIECYQNVAKRFSADSTATVA